MSLYRETADNGIEIEIDRTYEGELEIIVSDKEGDSIARFRLRRDEIIDLKNALQGVIEKGSSFV